MPLMQLRRDSNNRQPILEDQRKSNEHKLYVETSQEMYFKDPSSQPSNSFNFSSERKIHELPSSNWHNNSISKRNNQPYDSYSSSDERWKDSNPEYTRKINQSYTPQPSFKNDMTTPGNLNLHTELSSSRANNFSNPQLINNQKNDQPFYKQTSNISSSSSTFHNPVTQMLINSVIESVSSNPLLNLHPSFPSLIFVLRHYFNVSHTYVFYRICFLIFPYYRIIKIWKSISYSNSGDSNFLSPSNLTTRTNGNHQDYATLVDFYIPLMAFITYILLYGMTKGASGEFQPDLLGRQASIAITLTFIEIVIIKTTFYIVGPSSISTLNLVAFSCYKFVQLVMIVSIGLILKFISKDGYLSNAAPTIFWTVFLYFGFSCSTEICFFLMMDLKFNAESKDLTYSEPSKPRHKKYFSLIFALAQLPLCWFLTPRFF